MRPSTYSAGDGRNAAVFVDRDGTLNPDFHYLADADRLDLYLGVSTGVRLLREHGFQVICVTNQSAVDRGLCSTEDVERIHERLNERLTRNRARIDAFYYCPHTPEHGCGCRKPGTELFHRAAREHHLSLGRSALIGDRGMDIQAGESIGLLTAVVRPPGHENEVDVELKGLGVTPDLRADSFLGAARRILYRG
jgi:histidinol-phosphate phosphatase family protein